MSVGCPTKKYKFRSLGIYKGKHWNPITFVNVILAYHATTFMGTPKDQENKIIRYIKDEKTL